MVLGYVSTSWAGTYDTSRTLEQAMRDVDTYYEWYPALDGILLDEAPTECDAVSRRTTFEQPLDGYYMPLYEHIKAAGGTAKVVLNPRSHAVQECYMQAADIVVNFEGTHAEHMKLELQGWERAYPANRFWHLVYETPHHLLSTTITDAKRKHAGWMYVTPERYEAPWAMLPAAAYWRNEVGLVADGVQDGDMLDEGGHSDLRD
jgi:hypothetical protein